MDFKINPTSKESLNLYSKKDMGKKKEELEVKKDSAIIYEKSSEEKIKGDYSDINKNKYKIDMNEIKRLKDEFNNRMIDSFLLMAKDTVLSQNISYKEALERIIKEGNIKEEDIEKAKEDISEDGYFGVEKTSDRIIEFAKVISGGDPSKIETLKEAFKKGFEEAKKAWGGELPEISQKTYDRVMEKFDDWAKEGEKVEG